MSPEVSLSLPRRRRLKRGIVHDPASHYRHRWFDVFDPLGGNGETVAIEHNQVRQFARLDRTEIVLLENGVRILARVRDQRVLAADRLPQVLGAARHPTGNGKIPCRERQVLIGSRTIASQSPRDPAVLNRRQRRHIVGPVSESLVHDPAIDNCPRIHGRIDSELLHALELGRVDLIYVSENPAQVLDRIFLAERLDLVEERIDRVVQLRVYVQGQREERARWKVGWLRTVFCSS
jgi:hypothetical protein